MDSVGVAQAVEKTFETGSLYDPGYGRYGSSILNLLIYIPFRLITGIESSEKVILWSDIIFASLSVVVIFLLLQRMFAGNIVALFASVLFSVSPIFLSVTTYGKQHGAEVFFIMTAFLLLLYSGNKNSYLLLLSSSLAMAYSTLVRESAFVYVPFYFLFYINPAIELKRKLLFVKGISLEEEIFKPKRLLCIFIPFAVIFVSQLHYYLYSVLYEIFFGETTASNAFAGLSFPFLLDGLKSLYFNLSLFGVILSIAGFFILYFRHKNKFYPIFLLLLLTTFFIFVDSTVFKARFLIICTIPLFTFIAFSLEKIYRKNKIIGSTIFLALAIYLFLQIFPIISFRHIYSGPKEYALWLKTKVPQNSIIVVMDDAPFVEYYSKLKPMTHPVNDLEKTQKCIEDIKRYIRNGTPVYITETGFSYDNERIFLKALTENFILKLVGSHYNEHYQWAEISFGVYNARLFKLILK